jgi:hypothetical protein
MDLEKRQLLQKALEWAINGNEVIVLKCTKDRVIAIKPDFTCFETYVEATDADGMSITLPYEEIEDINADIK